MKIKFLTEIHRNNEIYNIGDIIDIPKENMSKWISKGWGEPIIKKELKVKKETKELKVKKTTK